MGSELSSAVLPETQILFRLDQARVAGREDRAEESHHGENDLAYEECLRGGHYDGAAVHSNGDGQSQGAFLIPLREELFRDAPCPVLVKVKALGDMSNVCALEAQQNDLDPVLLLGQRPGHCIEVSMRESGSNESETYSFS